MTNRIIIFFLGILIGIFVVSKYPKIKVKSDVELAKEKLEEFNRMEELCGKSNVRDKCRYGYCDSGIGLTCFSWRKAAHEAEKKVGE